MSLSVYTLKLLALAETLHRWLAILTGLDHANRERIADYAEAIAATLARAASALVRLDIQPFDGQARADAVKELGRITGYVETIVAVLEQHLDGRKIAGVKRRLDQLDIERLALSVMAETGETAELHGYLRICDPAAVAAAADANRMRAGRLLAAEGYLRALADGLRA